MHELSIALSLLDLVEEQSVQRNGAAITAIHLKLGPLSGVVPQALTSAYELAREHTPFAETALVITEIPITAQCLHCNAVRTVISLQHIACSVCGTPTAEIVTGREMEVTALEIIE